MSGDVQPRKRKDKRKKKDELGIEEPRGTAAALGEGDVFIHSHSDHGTGGHWCAKIIFFSLLAVLITLIGLIILENRGLTELEANSVESKYSGVLEGWIEDAPEDDHYDQHTLDLKHPENEDDEDHLASETDHDDDEEDEGQEIDDEHNEDEETESNEVEDNEDEENEDDDESLISEENREETEEIEEKIPYRRYNYEEKYIHDDDEEDNDEEDDKTSEEVEENENNLSDEEDYRQNADSGEYDDDVNNVDEDENDEHNAKYDNDDNEDEYENSDEYQENDQDDSELNKIEEDSVEDDGQDNDEDEIEKIESERDWEESAEKSYEERDHDESKAEEEEDVDDSRNVDDDDDDDEPPIEQITTPPAGKPFVEIEEEVTVKPVDTLAEEAEYERRQEELRKEKEEAKGSDEEGGNSIEDEWPGEPSDPFWREQLDMAEEELRQGALEPCVKRVSAPNLADSGRARWILAKALDASAEAKRDNKILSKAISAYLNLLKMNEQISDKKLIDISQRAINRIQFRGTYLNAEPIYRLLIRRFPQDVNYRNNLTVSFLMANRADMADEVLKETLRLWPNDRIALSHYGFVLKNHHNKLEEAVVALQKALECDSGPASEPRFYYHLGDALLLLGRFEEAHEVHKRGAALGHFLSPSQRSLYNVPRLQSRPWWPIEDTPYTKLARALEKSWREILKEGEAARALYEKEKEGLKERGEWSQLDIFVRGREIPGRCRTAPVTCAIVKTEAAAAGCTRGQIKFSAMEPGTHVRPHVGPTNCRLRMHLGLSNTKDTFIRVDKETRQWQLGKTFIFDDSFEHEVWHNGTGTRLVLIVDVWHPQLTPHERRTLPAI